MAQEGTGDHQIGAQCDGQWRYVGAGKLRTAAAATKMFTAGDVLAMAEETKPPVYKRGRLAGTMKIEASEGTSGPSH